MLGRALKAQLTLLAADPRDPLAARVRREVGAREAVRHIRFLRTLILATPEMVAQLCLWLDAPEMPPKLRRLHHRALASLYQAAPRSEPEQGLFNYFGDAYLVGSVYDVTVHQAGKALPPLLRSTETFPRQIPQWLESARLVFPAVTERIGQIIFA